MTAGVASAAQLLPTLYQSTVLADAPVCYLRLSESTGNFQDWSGFNRHSNTNGGSFSRVAGLLPNESDGAFDSALTGFASIPSASWMDFTTAVSIECIINVDLIDGVAHTIISRRNTTGTTAGTSFGIRITTANRINFYISDGTVINPTTSVGMTLTAGASYHVVGTYDGVNIKVYVNGVRQDSVARTGTVVASGRPIRIGRAELTSDAGYDGRIDEVAFYNTALTANQIAAHYAASKLSVSTAYAASVLSDSPWLYWGGPGRYGLAANTADLVTNGVDTNKDGILFGTTTGVAYNAAGPVGGLANGWTMANGNNFWRPSNSYGAQPATATYECWINVPATVSADSMHMTFTGISGATASGAGPTSGMLLTTAKKLRAVAYRGANDNTESPSALSTGWHHCVVSFGAAGQKIYVDGVLVSVDATKTTVMSISPTTWPHLHGQWNGANYNTLSLAGLVSSDAAFYPGVQLSDARVAAHYAAAA